MKDFDLPILEYCSLERAARFIGSGCEVEDILHWAEIGAINLSYSLKALKNTVPLLNSLVTWVILLHKYLIQVSLTIIILTFHLFQ